MFNKMTSALFGRASFDTFQAGQVQVNKSDAPSDPPWWKKVIEFCQTVVFTLFIGIIAAALVISISLIAYRWGYQNATMAERLARITGGSTANTAHISLSEKAIDTWSVQTALPFLIERKIQSLSIDLDGSENIFLGKFEDKALTRKQEAGLNYFLSLTAGNADARKLLDGLNLTSQDLSQIKNDLAEVHKLKGQVGHMRLGLYYLGQDVFRMAERDPTLARPLFLAPNDFAVERSPDRAFIHFQIASICGDGSAFDWRKAVSQAYNYDQAKISDLNTQAGKELEGIERRYNVDRGDYCSGAFLNDLIDEIKFGLKETAASDEQRCADPLPEDEEYCEFVETELMTVGEAGGARARDSVPTLRQLIELANNRTGRAGGSRPRGGNSSGGRWPWSTPTQNFTSGAGPDSQYFRNSPAAAATANVKTKVEEPGLDCAPGDTRCDASRERDRRDAAKCNDDAAYFFNQGEAEMAIGATYKARTRFRRAMSIGRTCASEYSVLASKRLAVLNLSCEYTTDSLARIQRDYDLAESRRGLTRPDGSPEGEGGAVIDLMSRQRALSALGHYDGNIDGKYGAMSREATKRFQREYGFSETGDLTAIETVYLICGAAQNANDLKSINTLGVMYMAGLGVAQNIDTGLYWLKLAADRGNSDAMFNLAIMYGSGTVASSYRLCGLVEDIRIADAYLQQASDANHPPARKLLTKFQNETPSKRWEEIRKELKINDLYRQRMEPVGDGCTPNP